MVRIGQEQGHIGRHHYSALVGSAHYKGEIKRRHVILMLVSLYMEREACPLSLLKGDMPPVRSVSLYLRNRRRTILTRSLPLITKVGVSPFTCVKGDVLY
jgi:hypothetical protein